LGGIIGLFVVDWQDALKMIAIRWLQMWKFLSGPMRFVVTTLIGLIDEDFANAIKAKQEKLDAWLDGWADSIYEKHGVTPMKGLAKRIAEDFAFAQQKIETFSKGLSAKPVLATGNAAFQEIHEFPALEEKTKKSVKKGVQEGLVAGIEAGSYDALKATAKAAMDGAWYAGGASHSATSSAVSRAEASSKASADRLSSIESMMRQLLEAVRGGASSLADLETF
jgi:hypothetical protein